MRMFNLGFLVLLVKLLFKKLLKVEDLEHGKLYHKQPLLKKEANKF